MTAPNQILRKDELIAWKRPFVYIWYKKEECLYVGATFAGISRLMLHNVIGVLEDFTEDDRIEIYYLPDNEIYLFEAKLIRELNPKYTLLPSTKFRDNKERTCPICKTKFMQKRSWQVYCTTSCSRKRYSIV